MTIQYVNIMITSLMLVTFLMIFNLRLRWYTKQSSVSEAVRVEFAELQKEQTLTRMFQEYKLGAAL